MNTNELFIEALSLGGYEINDYEPLDEQFKIMFLDYIDSGHYRNLDSEEEALDLIEEIGLEKVAKGMTKTLNRGVYYG